MRFVSEYYSTYYSLNGMIGFVVDEMDINENIENINTVNNNYFKESNTQQNLKHSNLIDNFDFHYLSKHTTNTDEKFILYHLMLDFSKNIV